MNKCFDCNCLWRYKVKISVVYVIALLVIFGGKQSYAATTNDSQKINYDDICEKALIAINELNYEDLEVYIGDIYPVVDSKGNIIGYSVGYYVDKEPYGYAVYDCISCKVMEFVFFPGVKNLYCELEEKAGDELNVDADNLIECVVYEGAFDYCVIDKNGNDVQYNEENKLKRGFKCENVKKIKKTAKYSCSTLNESGFDLLKKGKYDKVTEGAGVQEFRIIPDAGLVMITQDGIRKSGGSYGCTICSIAGVLNWMGEGDGNILNTYDKVWSALESKQAILHIFSDENGKQYLLPNHGGSCNQHGVHLKNRDRYDALRFLNDYWFSVYSKGISRVEYDNTITFSEIVNHLSGAKNGEASPFIMAIYIDNVPCDGISDFQHAVTVVSSLVTNNNKYVGIWNNWNLDVSDVSVTGDDLIGNVDSCSSAYRAVRYVSWDELTASNVATEALYFRKIQSSNIREARATYISGNKIEISCYVPSGTTSVVFPTWTDKNGQDDLIWHQGSISCGTVAKCTIELASHNMESGTYITHIYACDKNGKYAKVQPVYININPDISSIRVTNISKSGYNVSCKLPTGTKYVKFPTWSDKNGQDDLIWYNGNISGDGVGSIRINTSNHKNDTGLYYTHIYAYDKYDKLISCNGINAFIK